MNTIDIVEVLMEVERISKPYLAFYSLPEPHYDYGVAGVIESYLDSLGVQHSLHEIELTHDRGIFVFTWNNGFVLDTFHFFYHKEANTFG